MASRDTAKKTSGNAATPPTFSIFSRHMVTAKGVVPAVVKIAQGKITDVIHVSQVNASAEVLDFGDLVVMPGLVDTHVHINEPGRTEWEGFSSATQAAAAGGITTLVDMPLNCDPATTTVKALAEKVTAMSADKLWVDCGFYGGLVPGNDRELPGLAAAGVLGFKAFMIHSGIDDFPHVTKSDMRRAMPAIEKLGLPLLVHAELASPLSGDVTGGADEYMHFLQTRPQRWEIDAIKQLIELSRESGCHVHVVHLSSAQAVPVLQEARASGVRITVETCPHYLTLVAEDVGRGNTLFKCTPPIRERENQDGLWRALTRGEIDFIVSDHSPCIPSLKRLDDGDFMQAWGGIASLQFGLASVWTAAQARGLTIADVSRWMSTQPATLVGLGQRKGRIAAGYDADLVVWDPLGETPVNAASIKHRHKQTPYAGKVLRGAVQKTFLAGRLIYDGGTFVGGAQGQILRS